MKRIFLGVIALVLAVGILAPLPAAAQTQDGDIESITLSPVNHKYKIDAGQTANDKLTIVNDGKTDYDFIIYSRPYSITRSPSGEYDYTNPNFTATPANADAYGWIQFPKTRFHIKAGASLDVAYTMTVPKLASPGGHYGVIFAETQPPINKESANSVFRKKRVGSIIYATVNGKFITSGQLEGTSIPFWQLQPPLHADATVKNTGNSDITDDTTYVVKDMFGNKKFEQVKQYTILPQTTRKMPFEWPGASWFGLYKVELKQSVLGKESTQSSYVLMLPRYIPILILVILLIGGAYAWFRHKKK